ncbi:hypothetical protein ZIOFF_032416 [Zingiber officinale]|uniref:H(+)-exporting diphosphatase n=1 Tax=Zingiber officinale TaxID=94328 RepID=A0A8J5GIZ3_ZINOF|nr:hypothetical protein ZIOFF_032416 [Zingiber officinale]
MALFGIVGGGIYTKVVDVGADLVGKVERNIPEDDPRNPAFPFFLASHANPCVRCTKCFTCVCPTHCTVRAVLLLNAHSNPFAFVQLTTVALVVASISSFGVDLDFTTMCYPLLISSMEEIEPALKKQLIISTALMAIGIAIVTWVALPSSFTIFNFGEQKQVKNWQLFFYVAIGLWTGLVIGFVTEYYTSNAYSPVQDVADSCRTGAATNVIFRLTLGYKSIIIPIFAIAITIFVSFSLAAMYAMAVAALGMLSTIATGLAIDAYGPISESAGGNVEMAGMSHRIRERTENNIYHSIIRFSRFVEAELKLFHSQHR